MWRWSLVLVAACGGRDEAVSEPRSPVASAAMDAGVVIDAPPIDAPPIDASPPDAAPPIDAGPPVTSAPPPRKPSPDIADLGAPGAAVTLVPVAGKITVFDFWAPWCAPCKDLDRALHALAKQHPTRLAIRRVNVEDMDTPGALQHLVPGGFTLPHLKIYDARRRRVLESSDGVPALVARVRALVEAK